MCTIDEFVQEYLSTEQNLWHLVRSTNVAYNDDAIFHIYEAHGQMLSRTFAHASLDGLTDEQRDGSNETRLIERHVRRIVDNIQHINITAQNIHRILNDDHRFDDLPHAINGVLQTMPNTIATISQYTNGDFWNFVKNVVAHRVVFGCWLNSAFSCRIRKCAGMTVH